MTTAPRKDLTSSVAEFKKKKVGDIVNLPSGLRMRIKRTSLTGFLASGNIPNSLLRLISEKANEKSGKPDNDSVIDIADPTMMADIFKSVDAFVVEISIDPKVHAAPHDENERNDELLYVDEMEDEDRMFLFQRSLNPETSIASFRDQLAGGVGPVQSSKNVVVPAKRAPRSR